MRPSIATASFITLFSFATSVSAERVLSVETTQPRAAASDQQVRYVLGQVEARDSAELGFELPGKINALNVREGDRVRSGQVLAELDREILQSQRNEVLAGLAQAEATESLAQVSLQRLRDARDKGAITAQSIDEASQQLTAARASVRLYQSQLSTIDVQLSKHSIRAPFDGTVINKYQSQGAVVGAGTPVFTLQGNEQQLRVAVPEGVNFEVGNTINLPDQVTGQIYSALPTRNALTAASEILIDLPSSPWLAGDWVRIATEQTATMEGWWVPVSALKRGAGGWQLYRVEDGRALKTAVELLETDGIQALVQGPLEVADEVIAAGIHRMVPGQRVELAASQLGKADTQ